MFSECGRLKRVLLGDHLESISEECFWHSGLEEVSIPGSVTYIGPRAFEASSSLELVRFLGPSGNSSSESGDCNSLVIGERAFAECGSLRQVTFDPGSTPEEVQRMAFYRSGIESFEAPPSLQKIGVAAFGACTEMRDFRLSEDV